MGYIVYVGQFWLSKRFWNAIRTVAVFFGGLESRESDIFRHVRFLSHVLASQLISIDLE